MPLNRSVGFLLQRIPQTRRDTHEIKDKQSTCFAWYRSCVSHSAAIFLQTCRTPQKHCELLSSSLRGPGRTCLFVQEQWIRKKRISATARNSKSPPILQSGRSVSDTRFKIGSELAWSYGRGAQITAQKPDVARQNNPSSPQHISWLFSPFLRVLGLIHFLQGPKILPKQSPRLLHSAGEQWAQDTQLGCYRSRGWPQGTTVCTHHFPPLTYPYRQHCTLPYFQFNPLPDKPHVRVQTHPPALQRQQPLRSSSWWEHETIGAIKKGTQRKLLCIPLPTSSPRGPAGRQGSASQWMQCLFTAVRESCVPSPPTCTYILWFGFPSPRKAAYGGREKWIISTLHITSDVLTHSVLQFIL